MGRERGPRWQVTEGRTKGPRAGRTALRGQAGFLGGRVTCAVTHARAQKTQHLAGYSALAVLKCFIVFEQGALRFHLVAGLQITSLGPPRAYCLLHVYAESLLGP